jgi:hypothetical protein
MDDDIILTLGIFIVVTTIFLYSYLSIVCIVTIQRLAVDSLLCKTDGEKMTRIKVMHASLDREAGCLSLILGNEKKDQVTQECRKVVLLFELTGSPIDFP